MARVLYGVMGNTYGHVARTLAITGQLAEHEFHFVGGGRVPEVLGKTHPVLEVPVLRTKHSRRRLSVSQTIGQIASRTTEIPKVRRQILDLIERWQPHIAICDREFFLPIAARKSELPCLSIDHSHLLKACRYPVPASQSVYWSLAMINDYLFFDFTRHNLIVSFFHPALKGNGANELFPPVVRQIVRETKPSDGSHVLIYLSIPSFDQLIAAARELTRPVIVYGARKEYAIEGNITFKPFDTRTIVEDLASCAYAVVNGGHNLISEALYFGKPVLCFPIAGLFEQFLNVWYVREMGYGDFSHQLPTGPEIFRRFETRLDHCRQSIREKFVDGTIPVVNRVREIIRQHSA